MSGVIEASRQRIASSSRRLRLRSNNAERRNHPRVLPIAFLNRSPYSVRFRASDCSPPRGAAAAPHEDWTTDAVCLDRLDVTVAKPLCLLSVCTQADVLQPAFSPAA